MDKFNRFTTPIFEVADLLVKHYFSIMDTKGVILLAVQSVGEHYKCNICGNEVTVTRVGGGALVCCGQEMELVTVHDHKLPDDEIPA